MFVTFDVSNAGTVVKALQPPNIFSMFVTLDVLSRGTVVKALQELSI